MTSFVDGYIECALWASSYETEDGDTIQLEDYELADSARETLTQQAIEFETANATLLDEYVEYGHPIDYAGHDYWLTRNHHGAGFWARGMGKLGDKLTELAHAEGEVVLYLGDDELVYVS